MKVTALPEDEMKGDFLFDMVVRMVLAKIAVLRNITYESVCLAFE